MKKIFTIASIILFPAIGMAQFEPGQKVLGGNLSFNILDKDFPVTNADGYIYKTKSIGGGFNLSKARFYKTNALVGAAISYNYSNSTQKTSMRGNPPTNIIDTKTVSQSAGVSVFAQRFIPIAGNFFFTIQTSAGLSYTWGEDKDEVTKGVNKNKQYGIGAAVAPGVTYRINDRLLFDASLPGFLSLGYTHSREKSSPTANTIRGNTVNFSSSFNSSTLGNIGLGFRWLLKK